MCEVSKMLVLNRELLKSAVVGDRRSVASILSALNLAPSSFCSALATDHEPPATESLMTVAGKNHVYPSPQERASARIPPLVSGKLRACDPQQGGGRLSEGSL